MGLDLFPQPYLSILLLQDELLFVRNQVLHILELLGNLFSLQVSVVKAIFHDGDMLLESIKVLSQERKFLVEALLRVLGVMQLQLQVRNVPAFLCLDVQKDVNLSLHLILLPLQLLLKHFQLLICELLAGQLLGQTRVGISKAKQFHLQILKGIPKLSCLRLHINILIGYLLIGDFPPSNFSCQILNLDFILSSHPIDILLVFDFEHFDLIAFLFLELSESLLFECSFLNKLILMQVLLVSQLVHLTIELPVLDIKLARLQFQCLVLTHDGQLAIDSQ